MAGRFHSGKESNMEPCGGSVYARLGRYFPCSFRQLQAIWWPFEGFLKLWDRKHWCWTLIVLNGLHTTHLICFYMFRWWSTSVKWWQPKKFIKNEYDMDGRKCYACRNITFLLGPRTVSLNYWYHMSYNRPAHAPKCKGYILLRFVTQLKVQSDSTA